MNNGFSEKKMTEAIAYYDMKKYKQAEKALQELLAEDPRNNAAQFLLANCYFMLDQEDEAEKLCEELVATELAAEAFELLGKIYREKGYYQRAEESFLKALELDPQNAETLADYAYLLLLCGYYEKAREVMQEALRLEPENDLVLHYYYYFEHAVGKKKQEKKAIEEYMASSTDEVQKLIKLGQSEYKAHHYKKAEKHFRQAYLLDPTNPHILKMLEELQEINHFIFWPNRFFSWVQPLRFYVFFLLLLVVLSFLEERVGPPVGNIILPGYVGSVFVVAIWSWVSRPLYNLYLKIKGMMRR
ncbi:MAG: tetratricopeptide repeat protein [Peptococcia bacterium]|jgi:tetratricopeptide (TPR) repeat protein